MLKGEVNPLDQMVVEGLRLLFPELYTYVRDHEALFCKEARKGDFRGSEEELDAQVTLVMQKATKEEVKAAQELTKFLFCHKAKSSQPITELHYFRRHFEYALAADEISDTEMSSLLSLSEAPDDAHPGLVKQLSERNPLRLI